MGVALTITDLPPTNLSPTIYEQSDDQSKEGTEHVG